MAFTISPHYEVEYDFREYPGATITYKAWGPSDDPDSYDEQEATTALLALPLPMTVQALANPDPAIWVAVPLKGLKPTHVGAGVWEFVAEYRFEKGDDTDPATTFDTTGGTSRITQSKATVNGYPAPGYGVPNFGGAIGVTKDSIEGTDIVIPTYRWSDTYFFPNGTVDGTFKATLFAMTGRTNNAAFRGFLTGEVLFEGVKGQRRGVGKWELTYNFAASPNVTGLSVGPITGIAKQGWQYLWVRYHDFEDNTAGALVKRPVFAMVERVYDPGDFSLLGIGA